MSLFANSDEDSLSDPSRYVADGPALTKGRKRIWISILVAVVGMPILVTALALVWQESVRNGMRAECREQYAENSSGLANCLEVAWSWP
jgi:hypothetical protein